MFQEFTFVEFADYSLYKLISVRLKQEFNCGRNLKRGEGYTV